MDQTRSDPVSARNRCLCQSRLMIWLIGLGIQAKRGGLVIRRFYLSLLRGLGWLLLLTLRAIHAVATWPAVVVRWLWTSLFWPVDHSEPPCREITNLEALAQNPYADTSDWEPFKRWANCSMCALRKTARVSSLQVRRAGLHARFAFRQRTAWTFATVTGTLGMVLMIGMQLMYSFQMLGAKETPTLADAPQLKTRIDPGLPQARQFEPPVMELAQTDPFAAPATLPPQEINPVEATPLPDPWSTNLPPLEPIPAEPARQLPQPRAEDPWVDPLDNLPAFEPAPREIEPPVPAAPDPFASFPPIPEQPEPPTEPPPGQFVPFDPTTREPEAPIDAPVMQRPAEPFIDPLDNLPLSPVPLEIQSAPQPTLVEPPANQVEIGIGFLRLPQDDPERFVAESGTDFRRENLAQDLRFDAWDRYLEIQASPLPAQSYWERLSLDERRRLEEDLVRSTTATTYDAGPQGPSAVVNVDIAKLVPEHSTANQQLNYEIIVENRGREMLETVDVDEAVPPKHRLMDVQPAGVFENNLLRWRLREIQPGERRRLSVQVIPSETGTVETITSVRPVVQVGSSTLVEKSVELPKLQAESPTIRLRRFGYRRLSLDEAVVFTNYVQSLSKNTQRNVEIVEQVPAGFRVIDVGDDGVYDRRSGTISWTLAELPAGETVKLGVRLQAESTGELQSRVKAITSDGLADPIRARIFVNRVAAER